MKKRILSLALLLLSGAAFAEGGRYDNEFSWENPAELDRTKNYEVTGGLIMPNLHVPVTGTVTSASPVPPFPVPAPTPQAVNLEVKENYYLPGAKLAYRFNDKWIAGLVMGQNYLNDITYPFSSPLRYIIWRSKVNGYNIAPNLAFQYSDKFTFGFGLDFLRMSANLFKDFGNPGQPVPAGRVLPFELGASGWQLGWHAGMTAKLWLGSYIALSYFSKMNVHVNGPVSYNGNNLGTGTGSLQRPDLVRLKVFQALSKELGLVGRLTYVHWTDFKTIVANLPAGGPASQLTVPLFYRDSWIGEAGVRRVIKKVTVLGMVRYAKTPINGAFRNVSLPENNAWSTTIKADYNVNDSLSVFGRWSHVYQFNAPLNPPPLGNGSITGLARPYLDTFAIGASYKS